MQICDAGTKASLTTVDSMLVGVTHSGVSSDDLTCTWEAVSVVVPLARAAGGVLPARRYRASAAAAWASS